MKKKILKYILTDMKEKRIPLTKINIQKILFFLKETNIPITYKFELYLYGPFSFELKNDLYDMTMLKELIYNNDNKSEYMITDKMKIEQHIDEDILKAISDKINSFKKVVQQDGFSFDSMEIVGTIIYCIRALEKVHRKVNAKNVLMQFKIWKNKKYQDEEIKKCFNEFNQF